ncbi:MAG: hypothetical protein JKY45_00345 [Emcibacter sp.]|nr:hypothetical protein [Emcibacter sp.]
MSGCSSFQTQEPFYSAAVVTRADLLSGEGLLGDAAKQMTLPEDHVMKISDEMRRYLQRYVPKKTGQKKSGDVTRVRLLAKMIFEKGMLGMHYDVAKTHTAQDAFRFAEGNCLAFSYLFLTLARERGLKVRFQEVDIPPEWNPASKDLYYFSRHVNVRIYLKQNRDYVIDIDRVNFKSHYRVWELSDDQAVAQYYNNKATDYLQEGDVAKTFVYLVKALQLAPKDAAIWSNLGVMYRMQEMYHYAEKAYFIALKYDKRQRSVLNNLSVLYDQMGETEKSEYYARLTREHQLKNPYYRYYRALKAFEGGDYALSLSHLKAAVKRRDDEKKFHDLLGATYAQLGNETKANKAWNKAKKILSSQKY